MPTWLILLLCAILAVGLFVLGMSLTLMIKGHNIDSEISTNKNMQKLGIKCAVHETREADGGADCSDGQGVAGCSGNCGACDIEHISRDPKSRQAFAGPIPANRCCKYRRRRQRRRSNATGAERKPARKTTYIFENFDRQTNHGLRRSSSL